MRVFQIREHHAKIMKLGRYVELDNVGQSWAPELQIRGGIEDNSKIIVLISQQNICCTPH